MKESWLLDQEHDKPEAAYVRLVYDRRSLNLPDATIHTWAMKLENPPGCHHVRKFIRCLHDGTLTDEVITVDEMDILTERPAELHFLTGRLRERGR